MTQKLAVSLRAGDLVKAFWACYMLCDGELLVC